MARFALLLAAVVLLGALPAGAEAGSAGPPPPSHWLSWNAKKRTARLLLVAGYDSTNNGFNFDGYARGRMLVRVPRGWLLTIVCRNSGSQNHSCAVVHGAGTATIAFRGAASPNPGLGLAPGRSATFTFRASRLGVYRLVCLVPGHELAREYDVLDIVRSGRPGVEILSRSPG
jgi:Sulfocyanin (SoxE) domain